MPYLGRAATNAGSVNYLDDISSGFDGSDVTFTCAVKGTTITPGQENVYIYLDGVFQHPGESYTISGSTITFTEAPVNGTDFTAYVAGEGAYLDDGTVSTAKLDDDAVTASKLDDDGTGFQVGDLGVGGSLTSGDKLTVTGRLRASGGIIGNLTGDVTGDVTGDLTGNVTGNLTGNVTGNTSGTAATVTGAAQTNITSVGTLTGLTVAGATQVNNNNLTAKMTSAGSGIRVIADRVDTSDFAGFEVRTGGNQRWFMGAREDSTDNLQFFNGNSSGTVQNVLTLNHSDSSATFAGVVNCGGDLHVTNDATITSTARYWQVRSHTDNSKVTKQGYDGLYTAGAQHQYIQSAQDIKFYPGGTNEVTFADGGLATFAGNVTILGNLTIPEYIYHSGDTDTFIRFIDGGIAFSCDNTTPLVLDATGGTGMAVGGNATFSGNIQTTAVGIGKAVQSGYEIDGEVSSGNFNMRLKATGTNQGIRVDLDHHSGDTGQINFYNGGYSSTAIVSNELTNGLIFKVGGTSGSGKVDALRINNSGQIGIKTAPGSYSLKISGTLYADGTGQFANALMGEVSISGTNYAMFGSNSSGRGIALCRDGSASYVGIVIEGNGYIKAPYVYIGNTSSSANVHVTSDGFLYRSTSAKKYKTNIKNYNIGLDMINQMQPISYKANKKTTRDKDDKTHAGLLADDIHDLGLTEFVEYNDDGEVENLHYDRLITVCINAIKELSTKVTALEAK